MKPIRSIRVWWNLTIDNLSLGEFLVLCAHEFCDAHGQLMPKTIDLVIDRSVGTDLPDLHFRVSREDNKTIIERTQSFMPVNRKEAPGQSRSRRSSGGSAALRLGTGFHRRTQRYFGSRVKCKNCGAMTNSPSGSTDHNCYCVRDEHGVRIAIGVCCGRMVGEENLREEDNRPQNRRIKST